MPRSAEAHPVFVRLGLDHQRFSHVLSVLDDSARSDNPDWPLVRECLRYLVDYADAVHHKVEDVVFANLLDCALTDSERDAVVVNAKQHHTLAEASDRLSHDLDLVLQDVVVPATQIQQHLNQYVKAQRDHIRYENTYIFPLAHVHIHDAAWDKVSDDLVAVEDPVFNQRLDEYHRLYLLVEDLAAESLHENSD